MSIQAQYETGASVFKLTDTPTTGSAYPATDPSALGVRPVAAYLQAETEDIRFTADGSTPTASYGTLLVAGDDPFFLSGVPLNQLKFIRAASGAILNVTYSAALAIEGPQGPQGSAGTQGAQGAQGTTNLTLPALAALGVPVPKAVPLSAAQLNGLGTSPIDAVPAPGIGKAHLLLGVAAANTPGATPFANTSLSIYVYYGDPETGEYFDSASIDGMYSNTAKYRVLISPRIGGTASTWIIDKDIVENKALVLAADENNSEGDGTAEVTLIYATVNV